MDIYPTSKKETSWRKNWRILIFIYLLYFLFYKKIISVWWWPLKIHYYWIFFIETFTFWKLYIKETFSFDLKIVKKAPNWFCNMFLRNLEIPLKNYMWMNIMMLIVEVIEGETWIIWHIFSWFKMKVEVLQISTYSINLGLFQQWFLSPTLISYYFSYFLDWHCYKMYI